MPAFRAFLLTLILGVLATTSASARPVGPATEERGIPAGMPPELERVGVKEHLDGTLPLDAQFRDHEGRAVALREVWDGKRPMVLLFAFHSCPILCSMIISATVTGLKGIQWTVGKEFDVVVVSIDPNETLAKTAQKRAQTIKDYDRPGSEKGFHFLVGDKTNIDLLTSAAGFEYTYEEDTKQFGHASVVMVAKPTGAMARYLYGLEFSPNDLRLALFEASKGRSVSTLEQIILYCYHYDPKGGKYVLMASRVMQVGGVLTMIALGSMLSIFWLRERRRGGLIQAPQVDRALATPTQVTS